MKHAQDFLNCSAFLYQITSKFVQATFGARTLQSWIIFVTDYKHVLWL